MPYHPRPISSFEPKGPRDDTAYDTDFAMYYSLCTDDKLPVMIYNLLTLSKYVKIYTKYQHKQSESTTVILW